MKSKAKKRIIALILGLLLLIPMISAAETPLPVQLLTGKDPGPIRILISKPEVKKLAQFDENRTEQLNKLIRHLSLDLSLDGNLSSTGILINKEEAFSYLQRDGESGAERIYSFEPETVYAEEKKDTEEPDEDDFTVFLEQILIGSGREMDEYYALFARAPEAFEDRARKEGTELRFSGFGRAIQRVTISFPANYVKENFPKALADLAEDESLREKINGMTFEGNQKIGLLYDEAGKIVRINYDGKVGRTPEMLRKITLIWKVLREEDHQKDSISLKTPAMTGADKDNMTLERDIDNTDPAAGSYTWDIQIDHRAGKEDKKATRFTADLKRSEGVISGTMEYSYKRDGKNPKIRIYPEIREENEGEYSGTLEFADYSGKIEKNRYLAQVKLQKGEKLQWPEGAAGKAPGAQGEETTATPEETAVSLIIRKLFELPEKDLQYFSHEIPEDLWEELIH